MMPYSRRRYWIVRILTSRISAVFALDPSADASVHRRVYSLEVGQRRAGQRHRVDIGARERALRQVLVVDLVTLAQRDSSLDRVLELAHVLQVDEGLIAARAQGVNGARQLALACPTLARDQHRRARTRDSAREPVDVLHDRARAEQPLNPV